MPSPVIVFRKASPVLEARKVISSSEAASLQGKPALTPIIAGSICGGLLFISWTIGFVVYFRKRANRKKRKRLIEEGKAQLREKDLILLQQKVVIPPDPAVLLGQRKGGEMVFPERETSSPGRMPWSRLSRAIPASSSNGTSTSGTSEKCTGTPHTNGVDTKQHSDSVNDASDPPKLAFHTEVVDSSKPEAIDHSPEVPADDQVADVMTVPAKV